MSSGKATLSGRSELFCFLPTKTWASDSRYEDRRRILTWQLLLYDFLVKLMRTFYLKCWKEKRKEIN